MALESFYGGKQGVSPVIKAKFKYVTAEKDENNKYYDEAYGAKIKNQTNLTQEEAIYLNSFFDNKDYQKGDLVNWLDLATATLRGHSKQYPLITPFVMDECLKLVDYTDVWYGELCIIDTDSKMNPNNGKLYRRTLKQIKNQYRNTGDTLYAEYIGQIVGPSGGIPKFDFGSLNAERQKAVGTLSTYESESVPLNNSTWEYAYEKGDPNNNSQKTDDGIVTNIPETYKDIAVLESGIPAVAGSNTANIQMVPGKVGNKYNNTIKYTWCNVRRKFDNKEDDAWIYLGFEIPYTVYDVSGQEEDYTYNGNVFEDKSLSKYPFYKNYTFHIPRGARGIGPEEIFIVGEGDRFKSLKQNDKVYSFNDLIYEDKNNTNNDTGHDRYYLKNGAEPLNPASKSYWVAKYKIFNPKTEETPEYYFYIGAYKDVEFIEVKTNKNNEDYGQIYVTYSDNSTAIAIDNKLPLIKNITYNRETGRINFQHANGLTISTDLRIKDIQQMQISNGDQSPQPVYNLNNDGTLNKAENQTAINGHLYVLYRGETYYEDLGQVKGNAVAGVVYTLKSNSSDGTFSSPNDALYILGNKVYDDTQTDSIGGNGSGKIKVNGEEVTGGLVAASIKEAGSTDTYSALFYYDPILNKWTIAGKVGSSGLNNNGAEVYIQDQDISFGEEGAIYPAENDNNPKIYFKDTKTQSKHRTNEDNPNYNYNNIDILGYMPWQNSKAKTIVDM